MSTPALPPPEPYWQQKGCDHHHRSSVAYRRIRRLLRTTWPLREGAISRAGHYATCVMTLNKAHTGHAKLRRWREWRTEEPQRSWIQVHRTPMPYCTWGPESGGSYTARNPISSAGGKYQIIDGTWYANGGSHYADSHPAAAAPPLEQELVARNVLASQGPGAWVNC